MRFKERGCFCFFMLFIIIDIELTIYGDLISSRLEGVVMLFISQKLVEYSMTLLTLAIKY